MYIVKFDGEYIKSYDIKRINSRTVLKNVKTTDDIEKAIWMGSEDAAKLTALLKLRFIASPHIFEIINVNDINMKEDINIKEDIDIKDDNSAYIICIDDKFIHSIIVENNGIVDCNEVLDIDKALKIGDYLQAVMLKRFLISIDEKAMVRVVEV